jgi:hypothetical protein
MQRLDRFHEIELQQHALYCESQRSPGVLVLNAPTASGMRQRPAHAASETGAQRESQIWRRRSYVRHGVSPMADVYQSSWFVAHTVAFCAAAAAATASSASVSGARRGDGEHGGARGMRLCAAARGAKGNACGEQRAATRE